MSITISIWHSTINTHKMWHRQQQHPSPDPWRARSRTRVHMSFHKKEQFADIVHNKEGSISKFGQENSDDLSWKLVRNSHSEGKTIYIVNYFIKYFFVIFPVWSHCVILKSVIQCVHKCNFLSCVIVIHFKALRFLYIYFLCNLKYLWKCDQFKFLCNMYYSF